MNHVSIRRQAVQWIVMELRKSLPKNGPALCWNYQGQIGLYDYHSNPQNPKLWHISGTKAIKLHKQGKLLELIETEMAICKIQK